MHIDCPDRRLEENENGDTVDDGADIMVTSPFTQDRTRDAGRSGRDETHARTRHHESTRENANTPSSSVTVSHGTWTPRSKDSERVTLIYSPSLSNLFSQRRLS